MATVQEPKTRNRPESFVEAELDRARRRIRSQDIGLATLGLLAGTLVYALLMVLLDRWLVLPDLARQLGLFGFVAAAAVYVGVVLTRPLRNEVNPYFAARQVERALPGAKNSVVSWLDLHDQPLPASIRAAVTQKAAADLERADVDEIVRDRRLSWLGSVAGGLFVAALILLFLLRPNQFLSLLGRAFAPFGASGIAQQTNLELLQPASGDITVPVHTLVDFRLDVGGRIPNPNSPDAVRLRFRYNPADPVSEEIRLEQSPSEPQRFTVRIPSSRVQNGFTYQIVGGDAATPEYRVQVRSSPLVERFEVTYRFRPYLRFRDLTTANPNIEGLCGTQVTLTARTNRSIESGELKFLPVRPDQPARPPLQAERVQGEPSALRFRFKLEEDAKYTISFRTTDREESDSSIPYSIRVLSDHAPQVEISHAAPDTLPINGKIDVEGKASDDFGITAMRLCLQIADAAHPIALAAKPYRSGKSFKFDDGTFPRALDYKDFLPLDQLKTAIGLPVTLKPGMVIEYWLEAEDNCDSPKPNVGKSKVYRVTLADEQTPEDKQTGEKQAGEGKAEHDKKQDQDLAQENAGKQNQPAGDNAQPKDGQPQNGEGNQGDNIKNDLDDKIDRANKAAANERKRQGDRDKGDAKDNPPPKDGDQSPQPGEPKGDKNDKNQGNGQSSQPNQGGNKGDNQGNSQSPNPQQGGDKSEGKGDSKSNQPQAGGDKGESKPDQQPNPGAAKDMTSQTNNGGQNNSGDNKSPQQPNAGNKPDQSPGGQGNSGDNKSSPQQPNAGNKPDQSPGGQGNSGDNKSSPQQPNAGNKPDQSPGGQGNSGDNKSSPQQPNAGNKPDQSPGGQGNSGDNKSSPQQPNAGNKPDQSPGGQGNSGDNKSSPQQPNTGNKPDQSPGGQQNVSENKPANQGGSDNAGDKKDQPKNGQQPGESKEKSQPNGTGQKAGGDNSQGNPNETNAGSPPGHKASDNRPNEQKGSQPNEGPSDQGNSKSSNANRTPSENPQKSPDNGNSPPKKEPGSGGSPGQKDQASERPGQGPKKDPNNREPNGKPDANDPGRDGPGSQTGSGQPGGAQPNDNNKDQVPEGAGSGGTRDPGEAKSQSPTGSGNKGEAKPDGSTSDDNNPGERGGPTGKGQLQDAPKGGHDQPGAASTTKPTTEGTPSKSGPNGDRPPTQSPNENTPDRANGHTGAGQPKKNDQDQTGNDPKSGQGELSELARDLKSTDPQTRKAAERKLKDMLDKASNDPQARKKIEDAMKGEGNGNAEGPKKDGDPSTKNDPRNQQRPGDPTANAGQPKADPSRQPPKKGQDSQPGPGEPSNDPAQKTDNRSQPGGAKSGNPKTGDQEPNMKGQTGDAPGQVDPGNKIAGNEGTGAPTANQHGDQRSDSRPTTPEKGLTPDPKHAGKTSDLQLDRFPKNPSKEMLQELGMTPEQYTKFLQEVAELQKKRQAETAADRVRGGTGNSAANTGAKRVQGGGDKPNQLERGGPSLPPPEYRDGYKTFTEEVAKPAGGAKKD